MKQRHTYNVSADKKLRIEKLAIEASQKMGRTVQWTEIMDTLITEFGKDAQQMIIHRHEQEAQNKAA